MRLEGLASLGMNDACIMTPELLQATKSATMITGTLRSLNLAE